MKKGIDVVMMKKEVVAAPVPMQEHRLHPSNLDLLLPPLDVSVYFCYRRSDAWPFASMASVLKKAMAQVLVPFYAFAGELVESPLGEPELLCNNRGVDFFEASADHVELRLLDFYNPREAVEGCFLPKKGRGVLAVQVTRLKCGGVVVGCTFDHRVADSYSANMFLVAWSETALSVPVSTAPTFRREFLSPRRPGIVDPSVDLFYAPLSTLAPPKPNRPHKLCSRLYYVTAGNLCRLQSLANNKTTNEPCPERTKLVSFSALLWKILSKYGVVNGTEAMAKVGVIVDGRTRLSDVHDMSCYFGNVISIPFGAERACEMTEMPLSVVAERVHAFLESAMTKEHFMGLVDWVEARRPEPALARIYAGGVEEGPSVVVSSGQRFPIYDVDFGWGTAVFGSYHFDWGVSTGYVMPMPSPAGNGDWVVFVHLVEEQLEFLEAEASGVLCPLTSDYICSLDH